MDHILFLTVYFFFCSFVFIHFSCSWVTKYLECESLCSSCTRTEIIAMIIKKNMTKLHMHHFRGGPVYCCIVTHKKSLIWSKIMFWHFVLWPEYGMCFLFVPVSLFDMPHLQANDIEKKGFICQYLKFLQACVQAVIFPPSSLLRVSDGTALCTAHRYEYSTPMHEQSHGESVGSSVELVID